MLNGLAENSKFNINQLQNLAAVFVDESNAIGRMDKDKFGEVLTHHLPEFIDDELLDQIFSVCDADNSGTIDFKEFVLALSKLMMGSLDDKIAILFGMYDTDGDGTIDIMELVRIVQDGNQELRECLSFTEEAVAALDTNGDGEVSRHELQLALKSHSVLLDTLAKSIRVSVRGFDRFIFKCYTQI